MRFGILGSGSWGTAIAKILTDNGQSINWWNRSEKSINFIKERHHNPQYLQSARFNINKLHLSADVASVIKDSDVIIIAIPSAYVHETLNKLPDDIFVNKKVVSAVKGILPDQEILVNDYLNEFFSFPLEDYFAVLGPCHAEEIAAEKLSYLTFAGINEKSTSEIAAGFKTPYLNTVINKDIYGVQYAAVLKNIYALGAGIAHGLDYGDNFLSVLIANSADEMAGFLRKAGILNAEVGYIDHVNMQNIPVHSNYAASVYLGDLLVTCYSLFSRNRTFGTMIGKGYSVKAAQLEMSMVAEGYFASRCMFNINKNIGAEMPVASGIYEILWSEKEPKAAFKNIEKILV